MLAWKAHEEAWLLIAASKGKPVLAPRSAVVSWLPPEPLAAWALFASGVAVHFGFTAS